MIWHDPLDATVVAAVSQVSTALPTIIGRLVTTQANQTLAAHGSVDVSGALGPRNSQTVLLVHCDGTSGSTTFTDASAFAHPLTANGPTVSTAAPKFGTGCANFTSTQPSLVVGGSPADFNFGSGPFTLEAWCYFTVSPAGSSTYILTQYDPAANPSNSGFVFYVDGSSMGFVCGANVLVSGLYTLPLNTWVHLAAEGNGAGTLRIYANGTVTGSGTIPPLNVSTMPVVIGNTIDLARGVRGFIDEVRISRVVRYGGAFTPPAAPFVPDQGSIAQADQTISATGTVADPVHGFTLIAHTGSTTPGTNGSTTSAMDTTGANLLVVVASQYSGVSPGAVSDSKGNTWTALTGQTGGNSYARMFYSQGGTVGTGHVFSYSGGFSTFVVLAFSGAAASPFDVESGSSTNLYYGSSQPCPLTPSQDGSLIVSGCSIVDGGTTPYYESGGGFTTTDYVGFGYNSGTGDGQEGVVGGYLIQTTAAVANPTWYWTTGNLQSSAVIAAFRPAGSAPSAITGTLALSQADQTLAANGSVGYPPNTGTLTVTQAPQTIAASGGPRADATLGVTQADQTVIAAGGPRVGASLTQTQAAQSLAASGGGGVTATLAVAQAAQGLAAAGGPRVGATLGVTAAPDTIAAAGGTRIIGTLTLSQAPQTLVANAMVISGLGGALTVTQAPQTLAATAYVVPLTLGSLNLTQADQTLVAAGGTRVAGGLAISQADQHLASTVSIPVSGTLACTQADQWMSSAVRIAVGGALAATQEDQTVAAAGIVTVGAVLALIQDSQIVIAAGTISIAGTLNVTQADDSLAASGTSGAVIQARANMLA
jgi:hypothetical protein